MALRHIKFVAGFLVAGAIGMALSPKAQATMVAWGDPFVGHSWDATWSETSSSSFNSFKATIFGPGSASFEIPGINPILDWTIGALSANGKSISAAGPSTQNLVFSTRFIGTADDYTPDNQLFVDFKFMNNGVVVDEKLWAYDNVNRWVDPPIGAPDGGASLMLLGLSSLGIAGFRRFFKVVC